MTEPLPTGATAAGLSHASRLMWEVYLDLRRYTAQYRDRAIQETSVKVNDAVNVLTRMGADSPVGNPTPSVFPRLPEELDTPAARELLEQLKITLALAERVDRERGNYMADYEPSDLGSRGTDYAESVSHLACRLAMEIIPPKGRD
jgi:hypothetical protein